MHRLVRRVEAQLRSPPIASGAFEPNFVRLPEYGIFGLIGMPLNWRREQRTLDAGLGLASSSLVVVTLERLYVFDAWLLSWGGVRLLLDQPRDGLVATAVPLAQPRPAAESSPQFAGRAALKIENGTRECLAELAPQGWGDDVKAVFKVLTGREGLAVTTSEDGD